MSFLSTSELLLRHDHISFRKPVDDGSPGNEQIVIVPDTTGTKLIFAPSSFISTYPSGNIENLYPQKAAFTFDLYNQRVGIGGVINPQYAIDISSNTGINLQGGSFSGSGYNLVSVPTTALVSTLPTRLFSPQTIPAAAVIFGPQFFPEKSISLSSIVDLPTLPQLLSNNTIPLTLLASTGTLNLGAHGSLINGDVISTQLLLVSSINYGTITSPNVNALQVSSGSFTGNFFGDGTNLSNLNPANLSGSIPSDKFATHSIALAALQEFGNFQLIGGDINVITGKIAAPNFSGSNINISSIGLFDSSTGTNDYLNVSAGTLFINGLPVGVNSLDIGQITSLIQTNTRDVVSSPNLQGLVSTSYLTSQLASTVIGLGTAGYLSSAATIGGVISTANLVGLISTSYLQTQLASTVAGLGTAGYISSSQLQSTVEGLNTYISSFIDTAELTSTIVGLGTEGFVSTIGLNYSLASTVASLGSVGYVSTSQLLSTTLGVYGSMLTASGTVSPEQLASTVTGLGSAGYISSFTSYTLSTGTVSASSIGLIDTVTASTQNVTVANGSIQVNGSGIGNQVYTDNWFQRNLVDPPSSIYFGAPVSKSSQIFIPWTYPTQINVGFQPAWLQTIVALNGFISTNVVGLNPSTIINQLSTGYINQQNYRTSTSYITGLVLTKTTGTTGIQSIVFPQDGLTRNSLVYYNTALAGLTGQGRFGAWYQNYNIGSNVASTIFSAFSAGGPPTIPQRLFTGGITSNSLNFYFSSPSTIDNTDPTTAATISSYTISYTGIPVPGLRYGTPVYNSSITRSNAPFSFVSAIDGLGGQVIASIQSATLYPDSTYTFNVAATNTVGFTGETASTIGISTLNLLPITNTITTSFTSRYYTNTYRVYDNLNVTTLANTNTAWTSATFTLPIHLTTTRGSQVTNLAWISTCFTSPTVSAGPQVNFSGFPATTPSPGTVNNQTITPINVGDAFAASNASYQGFYLNMSNQVTIGTSAFVANSTIYTLQITGAQSTLRGVSTSQTTLSYYWDGSPGSAAITDITANYSSGTPPSNSLVSGVNIVYGTPTFSTITGASNLGNYFYRSPLINYTLNIGGTINSAVTETNLTRIISGCNAGALAQATRIVFSNGTIQSGSLATTFASNVSMSATATNVSGTSGSVAFTFSTIVDGPSYTLVNTTLPASLQTATTSAATTGCRIWSYSNFDATNVYVVPFCYTPVATPLSYTNYLYNHAYSLVDNTATYPAVKELQVVNGYHVSKGSLGNAYMNYNGYFYSATQSNTVTYTSIASNTTLRFATFAWNVATQGTNFTGAHFIINYNSNSSAAMAQSNNILVFTSPGNYPTNPTDKLFLFYRVEDQASMLPVTPYNTNASSVWLDANGTTGNVATGFNYSTDSTGNQTQILGGSATISFNTTAITFSNCFIPAFNTTGKTIRIICRFGVPMNFNFAFTTITLQLK